MLMLSGTSALAFVHVWFAGLAFTGLLSFTQPSQYELIHFVADSDWWGWIFGLIGLALIVVLFTGPEKHLVAMSRSCSTAAAFLGTWSFFTLLWGLTTSVPVSLAVFGPAVFSVVGAQVLAVAWNHQEHPTT